MSKKILVIDDEPDVINLLTIRLEANQYTVISAGNGEEGLKKLKEEQPDLIILDIIMPKMDGYTFVQEIKSLPEAKTTPIIILTAKNQMEDLFKIEGINDYVLKPFDKEELLQKIKSHL